LGRIGPFQTLHHIFDLRHLNDNFCHSLFLYIFILRGRDKSSSTHFTDTQETLAFFFISDAIEDVEPHFETVFFPAVGAELRWHRITPFSVLAFLLWVASSSARCYTQRAKAQGALADDR
jgi:hypothetical protein